MSLAKKANKNYNEVLVWFCCWLFTFLRTHSGPDLDWLVGLNVISLQVLGFSLSLSPSFFLSFFSDLGGETKVFFRRFVLFHYRTAKLTKLEPLCAIFFDFWKRFIYRGLIWGSWQRSEANDLHTFQRKIVQWIEFEINRALGGCKLIAAGWLANIFSWLTGRNYWRLPGRGWSHERGETETESEKCEFKEARNFLTRTHKQRVNLVAAAAATC